MSRRSNRPKFKLRFFVIMFVLVALVCGIVYLARHNNQTFSSRTSPTASVSGETQKEGKSEPEKVVPDDTTITMTVIGDIMCHNTQYMDAYNSSTKKYDFSYVFKDVKKQLQSADITVGNLETTFAGAKRGYSSYPTFNTPETLGNALKDAGLDVLCTVNNHCMDKGYTGLVSTIEKLDKLKIAHTGTYKSEEDSQKITVKDVNGIKIAFLGYTYGTNGIPVPTANSYAVNLIKKKKMKADLEAAKKLDVDAIAVFMHWGIEYQLAPNDTQKDLANFLFKNGADIILGSHPHVLQKMEKKTIKYEDGTTKDGFVIYSLGNFMSGQYFAHTQQSIVLDLKITKHGEDGHISIDSAKYTPIYMYKSPSKSRQRYLVMDIEKAMKNYKAGKGNISAATYSTISKELKQIKNLVGKEIEEKKQTTTENTDAVAEDDKKKTEN